MNKREKSDPETTNVPKTTQERSAHVAVEGGARATASRFNRRCFDHRRNDVASAYGHKQTKVSEAEAVW